MEASRRLAHTTTRLEQNKSEIDQQVVLFQDNINLTSESKTYCYNVLS